MMDVGLYSSGLHFWLKLWNSRRPGGVQGSSDGAAHMWRGMCWARRDLPLEAAQGGGGGGLWWCRRLRRCCGGGCAAERRAVKRRGRHIGLCRWILFRNYFVRGRVVLSVANEWCFFMWGRSRVQFTTGIFWKSRNFRAIMLVCKILGVRNHVKLKICSFVMNINWGEVL